MYASALKPFSLPNFLQYLGIIQEFRWSILFHIRMLQLWSHSTLILFYQISTILRYYSRIYMELRLFLQTHTIQQCVLERRICITRLCFNVCKKIDYTYSFTYLSSTVEASTDSSYYNRKQVLAADECYRH